MQTPISVRRKCQIRSFVTVCIAMLLCASCSNDDEPYGNAKTDAPFGFNVSLDSEATASRGVSTTGNVDSYEFGDRHNCEVEVFDGIDAKHNAVVASRGAMITSANSLNNFAVTAYKIGENQTWNGINPATDAVTYFSDMKVSKINGVWENSVNQYWPGAGSRLKFFAYAPADLNTITYDDNTPTLTYTVPEVSTNQPDLLEATAEHPGNYNSPVNLNFSHLLTAVQIKIKAKRTVADRLKKVSFKGIKGTGTYKFGSRQWDISNSEPTTVHYALPKALHITGRKDGHNVAVGNNTFMMIPQELSDNAELELTFEDYRSGEDRTLSCPISGKIWEQGKTVIYTISLHLNEFSVVLSTGAEDSPGTTVTNHSPFSSCWVTIGTIGTPEIHKHYMLGWSFEKFGQKVYEPIDDVLMTVPEGEEYTELYLYGVWPKEVWEYVVYDNDNYDYD